MWLKRVRRRIVTLLCGSVLILIFLQILACWWSSVQIGALGRILLLLVLACMSIAAYEIRKHYIIDTKPNIARRGAERTPLLPPNEEEES